MGWLVLRFNTRQHVWMIWLSVRHITKTEILGNYYTHEITYTIIKTLHFEVFRLTIL